MNNAPCSLIGHLHNSAPAYSAGNILISRMNNADGLLTMNQMSCNPARFPATIKRGARGVKIGAAPEAGGVKNSASPVSRGHSLARLGKKARP